MISLPDSPDTVSPDGAPCQKRNALHAERCEKGIGAKPGRNANGRRQLGMAERRHDLHGEEAQGCRGPERL